MKKSIISVAILATLGLSACNSGSSSSSSATADPVTGQAADGYLRGMFCYADMDDSGSFTDGDYPATAETNSSGEYSIVGDGADGASIVCRAEAGATDSATGNPFNGQLSAPAGSGFVTPLTTMVKEIGEDAVKAIFGTSLDGVALDSDPTKNVALAQAAVTLNVAVAGMTRLLYVQAGGDLDNVDTNTANAISKNVFAAFANQLKAKKDETSNFDLSSDTDGLGSVLQNTLNEATKVLTGDPDAVNDDANDLGAELSATITAVISYYATAEVADLASVQGDAETELNTQLDGFETSVSDSFTIADGVVDDSEVPDTVSGATSGIIGTAQ